MHSDIAELVSDRDISYKAASSGIEANCRGKEQLRGRHSRDTHQPGAILFH